MALRVVSLPATTRRMKKDATSDAVRASPSMLVVMRAEVTSSVGLTRRSSASSDMRSVSCCARLHERHQRVGARGTYSGSPWLRITLDAAKTVS